MEPTSSLLESTFLHAPGIARATERRLWESGAHSWESFLALPDEAWLELTKQAAEKAAPTVTSRSPLFSLGRGFGFSTALEQALKLMECALVSCKGYSIAPVTTVIPIAPATLGMLKFSRWVGGSQNM